MAFIPTPNAAKVIMPYDNGEQQWSNTLWFTKAGFGDSDMSALADEVGNCFFQAFDALFSTTVTYGTPVVYDMRTVDGHVITGGGTPGAGEATGDAIAPSVSALLTLRSADRGRFARGRLYVGGFTEPQMGPKGHWSGSIQTALEDFGTCMLAAAVSIGWTWVIRSIQENGIPLTVANTRPVVSSEVRSNLQVSQRRRTGRK